MPTKFYAWQARGFTLIELLAVVILLGLLSMSAVLALDNVKQDAEAKLTHVEASEIRKALRQFRTDVGHLPDAAGNMRAQDRLALLMDCQSTDATKVNETQGISYDAGCINWNRDLRRGWNGPYLFSAGMRDAWGRPYYLFDAADKTPLDDIDGVARIVSLGADGVDGAGGMTNEASDSCLPVSGSDDLVLCVHQ